MRAALLAAVAGLLVFAAACDGDDDTATPTTTGSPSATRTAAPDETPSAAGPTAAASETPAADEETPAGGGTPLGTVQPAEAPSGQAPAVTATAPPASEPPPPPAGGGITEAEARDKLGRAGLTTADVPSDFMLMSDTYADNATAASGPGAAAGSAELFEECGRLLGRTVSYLANDPQATAIAGLPVAYFSNVTAYSSAEGAEYCYNEQIRRGATGQGGNLALAFGELFVDPEAVAVNVVAFPSVGQQSLGITLSGDTDANGLIIGIVILLAFFREGPTISAVGAVRVVLAPDNSDVEPRARAVLGRIDTEFGQ